MMTTGEEHASCLEASGTQLLVVGWQQVDDHTWPTCFKVASGWLAELVSCVAGVLRSCLQQEWLEVDRNQWIPRCWVQPAGPPASHDAEAATGSGGRPLGRTSTTGSPVFIGTVVIVICYHFCSPLRQRDLSAGIPASASRLKKVPTFKEGTDSRKLPPKTTQKAERRDSAALRLVYNRVPKCGSTTLLTLLRRLSVKNGFQHFHCTTYDRRMLTRDEQSLMSATVSGSSSTEDTVTEEDYSVQR
ncbi:hypothetical protein MTO96_016297 [Rhipicephalus appendiculatus]